MSFSLPNPSVPTNGQALDATPILQNEVAIAQAIQSFDASQIQAGTLVASAFNANINPNTLLKETTLPFVQSGCLWSSVSSSPPVGTMTGGIVYINGFRVTVNSVPSHTFAINSDTYVDVDVNGNVSYSAVSNSSASPALVANSIRLGIVVTDGTGIIAINQGDINQGDAGALFPSLSGVILTVTDSRGNLIYPYDSKPTQLGYRYNSSDQTTVSNTAVQLSGLSATVIVPTTTRLKIKAFLANPSINGGTGDINLSIWDGTVGSGTNLQGSFDHYPIAGIGQVLATEVYVFVQAGTSKTYNVGWSTSAGTAHTNGSFTTVSYISVERV